MDFSDYYDEDYSSDQDMEEEEIDYQLSYSERNPEQRKKAYKVLSLNDIHHRTDEEISKISSTLSLSRSQAILLLVNSNWRSEEAIERWFADEEKIRTQLGLYNSPTIKKPPKTLKCGICLEIHRSINMKGGVCGHLFCIHCLKSYATIAIQDGPGCLSLRCPEYKCKSVIGEDLILSLDLRQDLNKRYSTFLARSYVESHLIKIKWCVAPGCEYAIEMDVGENCHYDVACACSYNFCWHCLEDAHRPVSCKTVGMWMEKNCAEGENINWIIAYTKPCPKCKRPIQKNAGCMHMTCGRPCMYEFCWMCLGDWKKHGSTTGCNAYSAAQNEGKFTTEDKKREWARQSVERYTHYYERWAGNESSKLKALSSLKAFKSSTVGVLGTNVGCRAQELEFVSEAWEQIVVCRRILKWTYAYGYYLPEHEDARKKLFEYLQGEAEYWLEQLHKSAEVDIQKFTCHVEHANDGEVRKYYDEFYTFKKNLVSLTPATRKFFENLVQGLEKGLKDVST